MSEFIIIETDVIDDAKTLHLFIGIVPKSNQNFKFTIINAVGNPKRAEPNLSRHKIKICNSNQFYQS
jgi:hypothetical protein